MKKTVLNSLHIKENLVNFNKIDFGCDYLTLSYRKPVTKLDELLFWVDSDNSNFWVVEIDWKSVSYNKIPTQNWFALTFVWEYNWVPTPLFQYVHFNRNTRQLFWKSAKICVYWSYFRLECIWEYSYHSLFNYIESLSEEDPDITRFDFRIDYFSKEKEVKIPKVNDILWYIHSQSDVILWKSWWKLVDRRVWNPDSWKYVIRYYDKKIDTNKKNKRFLYTDFLDYKSVHRLEIQFMRSFCRWYTLSQYNELERKILGVLNIDWHIYDKSVFYQYNSESEITLENAWRFIQRFMNQWKKLMKAWYNPFSIIEELMIKTYWPDVTKWLIDDFISKSCLNEVYLWNIK